MSFESESEIWFSSRMCTDYDSMYANESAVFGRVKSAVDWLIKRRSDWPLIVFCFCCSHGILRAREPDLWDRVGVLHPLLLPGHGGTRTKVRPILEYFFTAHLVFSNLICTVPVPRYRYTGTGNRYLLAL